MVPQASRGEPQAASQPADAVDNQPVRSGRRPGQSGARGAILAAARTRFAESGFNKTSIRAVAADAEVDAALVHHYFGTKQQLFAAAVELPIDPEPTIQAIKAAPLDQLGATLLGSLLSVWDSPAGPSIVAVVRSILAGGEPELAKKFILEVLLDTVRQRIETPEDDGSMRIGLVATQLVGTLIARKILNIAPIADTPIEELVTAIGPTLQRYLTGDIDRADGASA